jgi:hypothetical protein
MRRILSLALAVVAASVLAAGRAEALSVRDVIELSKAGLGEEVLLALIEVDPSIFAIDATTLKQLKASGVSDRVIVAMIKSGRTPRPEPAAAPAPESAPASGPRAHEPEVIVIDHRDAPAPSPAPAPAAVAYPVAVPVYVPVVTDARQRDRVETVLQTDQGYVKARVPVAPNCVKAEPVYWGFGGKLRPGSWEPPPMTVCR